MTAPTSDERREVAERLRKCGAELSILGADCETGFHVIDKVIGCREEDSWERFLARLADLIEPPEITEDTSDGILNARMTGELVRCGECIHFGRCPMRKGDGNGYCWQAKRREELTKDAKR